jgi:hypothetical protein
VLHRRKATLYVYISESRSLTRACTRLTRLRLLPRAQLFPPLVLLPASLEETRAEANKGLLMSRLL